MELCRVSMRRRSFEWSACLLGSGCFAPVQCLDYEWAMVSRWNPSKWNSINARGENLRCSGGRGARRVCTSCFACSSSSWAQQDPFIHSKRRRKISGSPVKLRWKFETLSPPATSQKRALVECPSFATFLTVMMNSFFSWEVSSKWAGLTYRPRIPDGLPIWTICSISIIAVFLSFSDYLNCVVSCIYLGLMSALFSQIFEKK